MRWRAAVAVALALGAVACGEDEQDTGPAADAVQDPGPVHVHGLGIDPRDGALLIATHSGLFRTPRGSARAARVGDSRQDTMGFTVVGPGRFLGSGHPDLQQSELPPYLGLIESRDGGRSWQPKSLLGKVDFHVLEARGRRVYGFGSDFETRSAVFLVSDDGGATWDERQPPEPLLALALHPRDADHVVASGEDGLHRSSDGGRTWRPLGGPAGLLAWSTDGLYAVGGDGTARRSTDEGRSWDEAGSIGGPPAALEATPGAFLAALHDGTVKASRDAGRTWPVRSRP